MTDGDQTAHILPERRVMACPSGSGPMTSLAASRGSPSADFAAGLVSLGFIRAAIRRSARFWCITAVVGLLVGSGLYVTSPLPTRPRHRSCSRSVPTRTSPSAAANDQAMAQSHAVAALAVHQLGLRQSVGSFLAAYTVAPITDRVLLITASAPSSNQAVLRANAVATAFLQFRADQMQTEQKLELAVARPAGQPGPGKYSARSTRRSASCRPSPRHPHSSRNSVVCRTERPQATSTLTNLEQTVIGNQTTIQPATAAAVKGSVVLNAAAPLSHSRLKPLLFYTAIGLVVGLVLGIGIVVVRALISDRLRRRDDIAQALGAPVKLSVGTIRLNRWLPGRRGLSAARDAERPADRCVPGPRGAGEVGAPPPWPSFP